jgi:competence protein ComEA
MSAMFAFTQQERLVALFFGIVILAGSLGNYLGKGSRPLGDFIRHAGTGAAQLKVDLNSATAEQLIQIPGIGEVLAHRIIDERQQNGPFQSREDLKRVKGIGPKIFEEIAPFIRVGEGKE